MIRIAFFICCLLLAGHPAQRLSAAQVVGQDIIAIDILLDPDATMVKKAKALNARLRQNYPKGFELGALHAPHISVAQRFVRAKDFDSVTAAVRNVLDAERPEGWQLKTVGYDYAVWAGVAVTVIVIERTPELESLQRKVLDAVAPFTVERGTAAAFVTSPASPDINPETINYVETFVQKWAGKNYVPHVTAGVAHEDFVKRLKAAPYKPFTFKIAGAGIYQLGNFGTAAKRLWSWAPASVAHK
jgi:hypothetical protein